MKEKINFATHIDFFGLRKEIDHEKNDIHLSYFVVLHVLHGERKCKERISNVCERYGVGRRAVL